MSQYNSTITRSFNQPSGTKVQWNEEQHKKEMVVKARE
jgi:hypothetical protein